MGAERGKSLEFGVRGSAFGADLIAVVAEKKCHDEEKGGGCRVGFRAPSCSSRRGRCVPPWRRVIL